ncbi:MAG: hypothetical protein LBO81_02205 [Clostridiales Family XIII bacterium]|jgi:X-X-X-Leu-X-X-Gly heptad repeat protein|nr:hypothetical protein [Clostridiales Family XIII bacterium]
MNRNETKKDAGRRRSRVKFFAARAAVPALIVALAATVIAGSGAASRTSAPGKASLSPNPTIRTDGTGAADVRTDETVVVSGAEETDADTAGIVSGKEEVVYANLTAGGAIKEIYAVNTLRVSRSGVIEDFGDYTKLKNLTGAEPLRRDGNRISVKADAGEFSYQGTVRAARLPWEIRISYALDGKELPPDKLAGQSGRLVVKLTASPNADVDPAFSGNYLLQITATMDSDVCRNITADGTVAHSGRNKVIASVVMPGKSGELTINADVRNFSMQGFELSAMPPAMRVDAPDTGAFTDDLNGLTDAISALNSGAKQLEDGAAALQNGAAALKSGSGDYAAGLQGLNANAQTLVEGSAQIGAALGQLSAALAQIAPPLASEVETLNAGHTNFHAGLIAYTEGISALSDAYGTIDAGIARFSGGAEELYRGVAALHGGLSELNDATAVLPDRIRTEIGKMSNAYNKSDFVPPSFADPENGKVDAVQFVMKTEAIEPPAEPEEAEETGASAGFWERLLALFR